MLAIIYIGAMIYLGERVCRPFYRFISVQHRLATSFLTGMVFSTCITYIGALAFAHTSHPLLAGNLVFLIAFAFIVYRFPRSAVAHHYERATANKLWDWIFLGIYFVFACWLMLVTLGFKGGSFQIPFKAWSDFGANLSLIQSFAVGHNFPTEHPFFPGEIIRYHFLFWFQAANLEFLGLNPVWSVNVLSIMSLLALLILIMALAEVLFSSKVVGRIAAFLFFFSTSLSFIPFLRGQPNIREAVHSILTGTQFIASGYPYRGEDWGALTVDVFANQRHLISAVGLLFVIVIFLVDRYQLALKAGGAAFQMPDHDRLVSDAASEFVEAGPNRSQTATLQRFAPYIFTGLLLGLLPYWNSAIFVAGMIIVAALLALLPRRIEIAALIATALLLGIPQVLLFRWGTVRPPEESLFHFGYTLHNPTVITVVKYLGWTFGFKWLLVFISFVLLPAFHRRLLLGLSSLVPVVFLFQLSTDLFNNHKLLNAWATFASVYAAYALWRIARLKIVGPVLAGLLMVLTIAEGVINLFPVRNDSLLVVPYKNDQLTDWVFTNTQPTDVFLTQTVLTHPILFAGRRVYLGYTLFAWSAGYNVGPREQIYRTMFEEQDAAALTQLLHENKIAYVGIDDGVRNNKVIKGLNEQVYLRNFEKVFDDTSHHYDNITIYKVPK